MKFEYISPINNRTITMEYDEYFSKEKVEERKKIFDFLLSLRESWEYVDLLEDELGDFGIYRFVDNDFHIDTPLIYIILVKNDIIYGYIKLFCGVRDYNIDLPYQYQGFMIHMLSIYSKKYEIDIWFDLHKAKMKNIFLQLGYSRSNCNYIISKKLALLLTVENAGLLLTRYSLWLEKKRLKDDSEYSEFSDNYRSFFTGSTKLMEEWLEYGIFNP